VSSMPDEAAGYATGVNALAVVDEKDIKTTLGPPLISMLRLRTNVEWSKCDALIWYTVHRMYRKIPKQPLVMPRIGCLISTAEVDSVHHTWSRNKRNEKANQIPASSSPFHPVPTVRQSMYLLCQFTNHFTLVSLLSLRTPSIASLDSSLRTGHVSIFISLLDTLHRVHSHFGRWGRMRRPLSYRLVLGEPLSGSALWHHVLARVPRHQNTFPNSLTPMCHLRSCQSSCWKKYWMFVLMQELAGVASVVIATLRYGNILVVAAGKVFEVAAVDGIGTVGFGSEGT
jgi:hypothetical protein